MFALRRLTAVVSAGPQLTRRFLLLPPNPNDVLLQRHDLLPRDQNYLQAIGKEDFMPSPIVEVAVAPRLAIVLPLQIEDGRVATHHRHWSTGFHVFGHGLSAGVSRAGCAGGGSWGLPLPPERSRLQGRHSSVQPAGVGSPPPPPS